MALSQTHRYGWHQGSRGSCTAHALAAAFQFNQARQSLEQ